MDEGQRVWYYLNGIGGVLRTRTSNLQHLAGKVVLE